MKVIGVITEYNPFHNGHQYQLQQLRQQTDADYIVTAMSGNFLQRGVCAMLDKYARTSMSLSCGTDLVIELPVLWATASAEYFASAGVYLLGSTGVIDTIGYGTECTSSQHRHLRRLALALTSDEDFRSSYEQAILRLQKEGMSYPSARLQAFRQFLPDTVSGEILSLLHEPNNILALEYEKAICRWNSSHDTQLTSCPISRIGDGYHQNSIGSSYASATAIRRILLQKPQTEESLSLLSSLIPSSTLHIVTDYQNNNRLISEDALSQMLYYRLLTLHPDDYTQFADCNYDLSRKIAKHLSDFVSFSQFCQLLKSKELTYTRISRTLLHILLNLTQQDYVRFFPYMDTSYLRVLGFRRDASALLSEIKRKGSAPLITKVADASHILNQTSYSLFEKDVFAADCYRGIAANQCQMVLPNEFCHPIIIHEKAVRITDIVTIHSRFTLDKNPGSLSCES